MFRTSRRFQAFATLLFGVFLAGYAVVKGRFDPTPGMYREGAYGALNHMIDSHGLPVVVLGILAVTVVAALLTLALPERR